MQYEFKALSAQAVDLIISTLAARPHAEVGGLCNYLQKQINDQEQAASKAQFDQAVADELARRAPDQTAQSYDNS